MSFYRTYRPQVIHDIDNVHVREQIVSLLKKERSELPHAYLLTGPKGSGKTTTARILAKLYNCTDYSKKTGPCGVCEQCTSIALGTNMDVLEIDAASNRGIDEMRELRGRIALSPVAGTYKVYIIDEVHMLTTEAFNALLKTLEEPPRHAIFVLATTDPQKVPATIKSRCIGIPFRQASKEELMQALGKIIKNEHIDIKDDAVAFIASVADGAFRDAVKLLEQVSFSKEKITVETVTDLLATSDDGVRETLFAALSMGDQKKALDVIAGLILDGKDIRLFITDSLRMLEKMMIAMRLGSYTGSWKEDQCRFLTEKLLAAYGQMKLSPIPELPLELAIMDFSLAYPVNKAENPKIEEAVKKDEPIDKKSEPVMQNAKGKLHDEKENDSITLEKLKECWKEVIAAVKPYNNSIAGVLRSATAQSVDHGVVTISTQYKFHQERLSEIKVRDILADVLKKLFGANVKVETVLEKK